MTTSDGHMMWIHTVHVMTVGIRDSIFSLGLWFLFVFVFFLNKLNFCHFTTRHVSFLLTSAFLSLHQTVTVCCFITSKKHHHKSFFDHNLLTAIQSTNNETDSFYELIHILSSDDWLFIDSQPWMMKRINVFVLLWCNRIINHLNQYIDVDQCRVTNLVKHSVPQKRCCLFCKDMF